jgi:hypothetical protein
MVTQYHTLLHFVTQNHTILSPTACAAASTRKPGVSKSHLLSDFHSVYAHTQSIAAGPMCKSALIPTVYGLQHSVINHAGIAAVYYSPAARMPYYTVTAMNPMIMPTAKHTVHTATRVNI